MLRDPALGSLHEGAPPAQGVVQSLKRLLQKPEATLHVVGWQDVIHNIVCVWASNGGLCNSL